jgi:hypothetical protein
MPIPGEGLIRSHVLAHVGHVPLSASRRLSASLRSEPGAMMLDLRVQISTGASWLTTGPALRIEIDKLPELLAVLERAIEKLPKL